MNTTEHILLIILASALALLLVLAISVMIMIVQLVKNLRRVASKAESIMESAESVTTMFRKASAPLTLLSFVRGVADSVAQHKQDHKNRE